MEEHIHLGDGPRGGITVLAVKRDIARVLAGFLKILFGLDEHPTRPACRVIYKHAGLRFYETHHESHHPCRRIELAAFFPGTVRKILYQVLVRCTE